LKRAILMILLCFAAVSAHAQARYSAVLRVLNVGIEFRRTHTEAWQRIAQNAEMPFGSGDMIRLNDEGRALITFVDGVEMLVLPHSELELLQLELTDDQFALRLDFVGQSAFYISDAISFSTFEIETGNAIVTQPARHFALQSDGETTRVVVADGEALVSVSASDVSVAAGDGVRITGDVIESVEALESPSHFARIDSVLDACPGVARATQRDSVNIRQGPGNGYDVIGEVLNGSEVEVVGTTPELDRYRVRFLSGFGWVVADGIITSCTDLPALPYDTIEHVYGVIGITEDDIRLLEPFFGTRADDYLFYPLPPAS